MDNRIIDVTIGLVLVFALCGLATSVLMELWVSVRKLRGRTLEKAVRSFVGEHPDTHGFADRVLAHPLIRSLADDDPGGWRTVGKPSYIGADVFVNALVARLVQIYCAGVRPESPRAFVEALRLPAPAAPAVPVGANSALPATRAGLDPAAATHALPSPALIEGLFDLAEGVDADWNAYLKRLCAWYDAVGERSTGWYKRATQLRLFVVGLLLAAAVNINPFVIGPRLWHDDALRQATVGAAERAVKAYADAASAPSDEAIRTIVVSLAPPGATQPTPGSTAPVATTATTPNEPTGVRALDVELQLKALESALGERALARARARQNAATNGLQDAAATLAELRRFVELRRTAAREGRTGEVSNADELARQRMDRLREQFAAATVAQDDRSALERQRLRLVDALAAEHAQRAGTRRPAVLCPPDADERERALCAQVATITDGLVQLGIPIGWNAANLPPCSDGPCGATASPAPAVDSRTPPWSALAQTSASAPVATTVAMPTAVTPTAGQPPELASAASLCLRDLRCSGLSMAGWIVTATACMLGAPFWFDLLSKLIRLRGAGRRPEEVASATGGAAAGAPEASSPGGTLATPAPVLATAAGAVDAQSTTMRDVQTVAEARLTPTQITEIQSGTLKNFGARPSGFFDDTTRAAIVAWQKATGQPETGELTPAQIEQLLGTAAAADALATLAAADDDVDGCDAHVDVAEPDENLPPSQGGVA